MQQRLLLQILLLAQHVSGTIIPIIRSSRVIQMVAACAKVPSTTGSNHLYNS